MTEDILFEEAGRVALVTLNRPKALNALTHDMALRLEERLLHWREDERVAAVAIMGAGEKAFCAGGDIRALYDAGREDGSNNFQFYADEYRLNALIKRYPKPYVALMDGIVMGGGVGVSVHGSLRVAGDATLFAMPETGIGLFPDVGGTFFLPRLPGETGMWLGLTGARLRAADALAAKVCDLYIPSARIGAAIDALIASDFSDEPHRAVSTALARFEEAPPGEARLPGLAPAIDRCFGAESIEAALQRLSLEETEWAEAQRAAILSKSPTCERLAFRQLREGARLDFEACMRLEYQLARFCMTHPDFYEGVRATIMEKGAAPAWRPGSLDEVDDASVAAAFEPLAEDEALKL